MPQEKPDNILVTKQSPHILDNREYINGRRITEYCGLVDVFVDNVHKSYHALERRHKSLQEAFCTHAAQRGANAVINVSSTEPTSNTWHYTGEAVILAEND
jgi:uncharacterized protein YbjQ (UPF0145 family)